MRLMKTTFASSRMFWSRCQADRLSLCFPSASPQENWHTWRFTHLCQTSVRRHCHTQYTHTHTARTHTHTHTHTHTPHTHTHTHTYKHTHTHTHTHKHTHTNT